MKFPKALHMVAKMEGYRQTMKDVYGAEYPAKVEPFKEVIRAAMVKTGQGELDCLIEICKEDEGFKPNGVSTILFIAAALDVMEENTSPARPAEGAADAVR